MNKYKCAKCGKVLQLGDVAWNRWGNLYCDDCDKKYPAPLMAVYYGGKLK